MRRKKTSSRPSKLISALVAIVGTGIAVWEVIVFVRTGVARVPLMLFSLWLTTYHIHNLVSDGTS